VLIKILTPEQFSSFQASRLFWGSPDDLRDGFVHLCTPAQLEGTIEAHFDNAVELVLVEVEPETLGDALIFETSRRGEAFPHLYRELRWSDVRTVSRRR
jgi:uncharacterized protein (DUF952 family)